VSYLRLVFSGFVVIWGGWVGGAGARFGPGLRAGGCVLLGAALMVNAGTNNYISTKTFPASQQKYPEQKFQSLQQEDGHGPLMLSKVHEWSTAWGCVYGGCRKARRKKKKPNFKPIIKLDRTATGGGEGGQKEAPAQKERRKTCKQGFRCAQCEGW